MTSFSIIICTHNPDEYIFGRVLTAIGKLEVENLVHEVIIVDNNSSPALEDRKEVMDWISGRDNTQIIKEPKPGLTAARIAGIHKSRYDWIIFFDDDNEPAADYLLQLQSGIYNYPQVNCWGPGTIDVYYIPGAKPWFYKHKTFFQQRKEKTNFGNEPYWQQYYPIGTGLCIKKEALASYIAKVEKGIYNISDRTGKSLLSGGDAQMVLNNQTRGGMAGKLEGLFLNHLIEKRKITLGYLSKQKFWTAASYIKVLKQVYPDFDVNIKRQFSIKDILQVIKKFYNEIKVKKNDLRTGYLNTCGYLGEVYAPYIAAGIKPSSTLRVIKKLLISTKK